MSKQFSAACERNRVPIITILRDIFADRKRVLEIGSGTGQHAVYFAAELPHLIWQTSDMSVNHASITAWAQEADLPNLLPPLSLDVNLKTWPEKNFDAAFSANTCHIMSWNEVKAMFAGLSQSLLPGSILSIYGPFNYGGQYTSESNAQFDASLKQRIPHMGIRDFESMNELANSFGFILKEDFEMPANNRLLVWCFMR